MLCFKGFLCYYMLLDLRRNEVGEYLRHVWHGAYLRVFYLRACLALLYDR
jgi:hypothetical protein